MHTDGEHKKITKGLSLRFEKQHLQKQTGKTTHGEKDSTKSVQTQHCEKPACLEGKEDERTGWGEEATWNGSLVLSSVHIQRAPVMFPKRGLQVLPGETFLAEWLLSGLCSGGRRRVSLYFLFLLVLFAVSSVSLFPVAPALAVHQVSGEFGGWQGVHPQHLVDLAECHQA